MKYYRFKILFSLAVLLAVTLLASAGEFWLEPVKFYFEIGEQMKVDFREGDGFTGELWDTGKNKAERIQWYTTSATRDLTKTVDPLHRNNVLLKLTAGGTQLLTLTTVTQYRAWSWRQFDNYLEEQDLGYIADLRKKTSPLADSTREIYTRFAKVLVQVGGKTDDTFKKKTGQRLEIIPAKNPYTLTTGDYLQCQILFEGRPLPHALVKVWSRLNTTTFLQNIYSEKDGTIVFPLSTKGAWMVSVIKMIPSEKPEADWHSLWGSLVFGI